MRTLSATLQASQESSNLQPRIKITFSKTGQSDIVVEQDRILRVTSQEETTDKQNIEVIFNNSDGYFTSLDLKGWNAVFQWGLVTTAGAEYSALPTTKVISQYLTSAPGILQCRMSLVGIPNLLAEDKASDDYLLHKSSTKTVKDLFTEVADGAAVDGEQTEEQTTSDSYIGLDANIWLAGQRLVLSETVTKLSFKLKKTGSPTGNITFRIRDVEQTQLSSKVLGDASTLTTSPVWYEVTFTTPVVPNASFPEHWIYCEYVGGDASNYVQVAYNSSNVKAGEWYVEKNTTDEVPANFSNYDCAYRYKYTGAGVGVFSHCEAYEVVYDSEDALIDVYTPQDGFRINEGESRLDVLNRLLQYTGCAKRIEADGKIHVFVPTTTGTTYDSEYSLASGEHAFFSKVTRNALVIPNKITVHSYPDDADQYTGLATDATSFALLPMPDFVRAKLISNAQAEDIAEAMIARLQVEGQRGTASVPNNLGAEVYDYIKVTDARQSDSRVGNIGYIHRSYTPGTVPTMTFSFGKTALKAVAGTRPSLLPSGRQLSEPKEEGEKTSWEFLKPIIQEIFGLLDDIVTVLESFKKRLGWLENEATPATPYFTKEEIISEFPKTSAFEFIIDGGGSVITTGQKGHIEVPFDCSIKQVTMLADQSGSIVVDVWKDTYANFAPTDADSITASSPPTITTATKSQDAALTGWTTALSDGDVLAFNVDSCTTITRALLTLIVRKA